MSKMEYASDEYSYFESSSEEEHQISKKGMINAFVLFLLTESARLQSFGR